jgi:predicted metalloenzyme YecM
VLQLLSPNATKADRETNKAHTVLVFPHASTAGWEHLNLVMPLHMKETRQNMVLFKGAVPLSNAIHFDQCSKMTKRMNPNL